MLTKNIKLFNNKTYLKKSDDNLTRNLKKNIGLINTQTQLKDLNSNEFFYFNSNDSKKKNSNNISQRNINIPHSNDNSTGKKKVVDQFFFLNDFFNTSKNSIILNDNLKKVNFFDLSFFDFSQDDNFFFNNSNVSSTQKNLYQDDLFAHDDFLESDNEFLKEILYNDLNQSKTETNLFNLDLTAINMSNNISPMESKSSPTNSFDFLVPNNSVKKNSFKSNYNYKLKEIDNSNFLPETTFPNKDILFNNNFRSINISNDNFMNNEKNTGIILNNSTLQNKFENDSNLKKNKILNDLLINLIEIDYSNINNYLLNLIKKFNNLLPIDDLFRLIFVNKIHNEFSIILNYENKIDRSFVTFIDNNAIETLTVIIEILKNPFHLFDCFPNIISENKLFSMNCNELLKNLLAIKILYSILIQFPEKTSENIHKFAIPRISIYKTYYIICKKLIFSYLKTINFNQKIIVGQSKLGKLFKLIYPNVLIKRLGSRGKSKYNYLGVAWNQFIINDELKNLCENLDIIEINNYFNLISSK